MKSDPFRAAAHPPPSDSKTGRPVVYMLPPLPQTTCGHHQHLGVCSLLVSGTVSTGADKMGT